MRFLVRYGMLKHVAIGLGGVVREVGVEFWYQIKSPSYEEHPHENSSG